MKLQKAAADARAQFYFAVDQPFRQWLQAIDPEQDDPDEAVAALGGAGAPHVAEELGATDGAERPEMPP